MCNSVYFISLGPGDPDLVTIKAFSTLQGADIVFYPSTIGKSGQRISRALDILKQLGISVDKLHPFNVPMSKNRSSALESYRDVSACIVSEYNKGLKIVIVAEGDGGFYSSIHYIYDYLIERNISVKQIAGIPAFIASGALAGIHIVKQEEELVVIPGTTTKETLSEYLKSQKTLVIMKVSQCDETIRSLIKEQPYHTYHYFENVGLPEKEYYTSNQDEILNRSIPYFSLMIIKP